MNRKLRLVLVAACLLAALSGAAFTRIAAQNALVITLNFEFLRQGTAGTISLTGEGVVGGVAAVFDRTFPFFPVTGGFAAVIAVPIEQRIKDYPITVTVYQAGGGSANWTGTLDVFSGEFIREPIFTIPSDKAFLLNPVIQTNEDDRLIQIYSVITAERFWEGQFKWPVNAPLTSPFGSVRDFSDGSVRRHTGYDFRLETGVPVMSTASGRVVFARNMDIHGNIIIIDHGWGVFSSYSHFSQMFVVPGQYVLQGEVLGLSGNTGRSTGPHLHWEVAVNGVWVNPIEFAKLKLPT